MNVSLVMFKADGSRRDFPVTKQRVVVGRKNDCDLRIPLTSVSRQHCEFLLEDQTFKLKDLGSSNGTYHNSTRVQEATLSAGDEVIVGPVVFTVVIDGYPEEIQPVRTILDSHASDGESPHLTSMESPRSLEARGQGDAIDQPVEPEQSTPTVEYDDPIAALEAMAEDKGSENHNHADQSDSEEADDSELKLLDEDKNDSSKP